jgi:uncharacterized membrane protein
MRRVIGFLTILITSIAALIATTVLGFAIFNTNQTNAHSQDGWMNSMWGQGSMMGQTTTQTATNPLLPYFGVLFAVLIAVTVLGIVGMGYYLLYPQMRMGAVSPAIHAAQPTVDAYESVSKTLTAEERQIIAVLNNHNGKYLQKYIKSETGLSRLKTHRILARLADRGIVTLEKTGNTNQVTIANWLTDLKINHTN